VRGIRDGLVIAPAVITTALRDASGLLSIHQVAHLMNLSPSQVYGWLSCGLPISHKREGRGNDKIRVDADVLRAWLEDYKPSVWIQEETDGLLCTKTEYQKRLGMCQNMLERWGL
jgi:phage terminase Nu1 subunit (DNA packaging protein)